MAKTSVATFKVQCDDFRMLLKRLSRFVAKEDTRPVLMAVKLEAGKSNLKGIAANGYILGCQTIEYLEYPKSVGEILVLPTTLLSALGTVHRSAELAVTFGEVFRVEAPNIDISVPSVKGTFPKYETLKPSSNITGHVTTLNPDLLQLLNLGGATMLDIQIGGSKDIIPVASNDGFWGLLMPMFVDEKDRKKRLSQAISQKPTKNPA